MDQWFSAAPVGLWLIEIACGVSQPIRRGRDDVAIIGEEGAGDAV